MRRHAVESVLHSEHRAPRGQRQSGHARWLALALVALTAALFSGCEKPAAPTAPRSDSGVPVSVAKVAREDVPVQVRAIGWIEAYATVAVRPQVDGQLQEIHFAEGQDIKKGDLLFTIDSRPFQAALKLVRGALDRDRAMAEWSRREAARIAELFAKLEASDRERDQTQADADAKAAQVESDTATVERERLNVEYCSIRSPIAGRAGAYLVHRGNILEANKTELVDINQIHPIYIAFSVPEQYVGAIQRGMSGGGMSVQARSADDDSPPEPGTLTFLDNQVDKSTGMLRLKATFQNEDGRLWPGRFANVTLTTARLPDAVVVPATAVQPGQNQPFVYVVKSDGTVAPQPVETGYATQDRVVVTAGLNGEETVVTDGQLRLTAGAKIKVKDSVAGAVSTQPTSAPAAATPASGPVGAMAERQGPPR